jgi:hypothetical protein
VEPLVALPLLLLLPVLLFAPNRLDAPSLIGDISNAETTLLVTTPNKEVDSIKDIVMLAITRHVLLVVVVVLFETYACVQYSLIVCKFI